jgi:hypothetical protein
MRTLPVCCHSLLFCLIVGGTSKAAVAVVKAPAKDDYDEVFASKKPAAPAPAPVKAVPPKTTKAASMFDDDDDDVVPAKPTVKLDAGLQKSSSTDPKPVAPKKLPDMFADSDDEDSGPFAKPKQSAPAPAPVVKEVPVAVPVKVAEPARVAPAVTVPSLKEKTKTPFDDDDDDLFTAKPAAKPPATASAPPTVKPTATAAPVKEPIKSTSSAADEEVRVWCEYCTDFAGCI